MLIINIFFLLEALPQGSRWLWKGQLVSREITEFKGKTELTAVTRSETELLWWESMQELDCLSGKDASRIKAWGFTSKTGTVKLIPACPCRLIVSCCFYVFKGLCSTLWTCTTLACLACRSFYQSPQHRLIAQHPADACAQQALARLVWPGQACYTAGLPLGECGEYTIVTDLRPLHTCVHDELWACLAPAQPTLPASDGLSQYRMSADWHLFSDKLFSLTACCFSSWICVLVCLLPNFTEYSTWH